MLPRPNNSAFIYTLSDPRTNQVRYVGKTFDLQMRFYQHLSCARRNFKARVYFWIRALLKSGVSPVMEVIEVFPEDDTPSWEQAERFWIETLRFYGCNLTNLDSGDGSGRRASMSTRLKIGAHSKKRVHSAATRAKIGASCKARMTEAAKEHLRQVAKTLNFHHTDEMKLHMSALKKGIPKPAHVNIAREAGRAIWLANRRAAGLPTAPHPPRHTLQN